MSFLGRSNRKVSVVVKEETKMDFWMKAFLQAWAWNDSKEAGIAADEAVHELMSRFEDGYEA